MRFSPLIIFYFATILLFANCKYDNHQAIGKRQLKDTKILFIQPLGSFSDSIEKMLAKGLSNTFPIKIFLRPSIPLPANAWYKARHRYWADSILILLHNQLKNPHMYILGITEEDISTKKDLRQNWGVMGLGYQPGNCCVVSTYRLNKYPQTQQQLVEKLIKVAAHEMGHNFGLTHCANKYCIMADANGKDHLDDEKYFCIKCAKTLTDKGLQPNNEVVNF